MKWVLPHGALARVLQRKLVSSDLEWQQAWAQLISATSFRTRVSPLARPALLQAEES